MNKPAGHEPAGTPFWSAWVGAVVDSELEELLLAGEDMSCRREASTEKAVKWLKVRDRAGKLVPLVANSAQQAFEANRGRKNIVLKARQMGMTTWIAGRFFLRTITAQGVLTVQVAQNRQASESIFRIVQRMWENLPDELRKGPLVRSRANVGQMVFPKLDSEFRVWSAGDENAGRGISIHNLHCSEVSRWPRDAGATLAGLRAALVPGGELVLESTPNGAYGAFYDEWTRGIDVGDGSLLDQDVGLLRHFLPWWMEPAYVGESVDRESMSAEELAFVDTHGLTGQQIGFRRGLERGFGKLRPQEYAEDAEVCFRATGNCCFDIEALERRLVEVASATSEARRGGALLIWMQALPGREYIVAVDTAGGGPDGDFAAVQVIDAATGVQCAELQERLDPLELAHVAADLAREYGGALTVVERNNHGGTVVAYLSTVERYERLYRQDGQAGWLTTSVSKPEIVSRLGALLVDRPQMFLSRRLLGECRTFVRNEHGRSSAASGAHDDLVMSMALAQAVRAEKLECSTRQ